MSTQHPLRTPGAQHSSVWPFLQSTRTKPNTWLASSLVAVCLVTAGLSGAAQAALVDRGGGLIYDTDLNVTWLQDTNYAQTSGYDADGLMTWSQATTWAANLSYYDSVRNVTYTDWRLPTTTDTGTSGCNYAYSGTDCGYNVNPASSEMAHLYFTELGNLSAYTTSGAFRGGSIGVNWGLVNKGSFVNFQSNYYWSGTGYAPDPSYAWSFYTVSGNQDYNIKANRFFASFYALAVRPGDVAAVPEAQTYALMLAGLGLVGAAVRRRKRGI
jgi:hypothetical protein